MKILVIDDEKTLLKGLKFNLEHEGYTVVTGEDGEDAVRLCRTEEFDLVLLDIMMPKTDGLTAARRIREFSSVPIMMLTASGDDADKLIGFESGADDYITKPFNIMILKARIRAILRRTARRADEAEPSAAFGFGGVTLNPVTGLVTKNNQPVALTTREFKIVELLLKTPGKIYSREELLSLVWEPGQNADMRTVDVHIRRIREKLEDDPAHPAIFMTKWGVGYYSQITDNR